MGDMMQEERRHTPDNARVRRPRYACRPRPLVVMLLAVLALPLATCGREEPTAPGSADLPSFDAAVTPPVEVLVGAGNITRCDGKNDEATGKLLDGIAGTVFTTGDNIRDSGSPSDFSTCYEPAWGRFKGRTRPSSGDYDYLTTGAAGYFGYFGVAAGDPLKGYYSYDLGEWHVVVLNSNLDMSATSSQGQWLTADLAANTKQCTLGYWHYPRFSSNGTAVRAPIKPTWDALYAAGADVVLNAHSRLYERFAPQRPDGTTDTVNGIRQFTVGTGGQGIDQVNAANIRPNSEVRGFTYGVLRLSLGAGNYAWQFIPVAGQSFTDSGSGLCHKRIASVGSVDVTPSAATVPVGARAQLRATVRDDQGNLLSRPVTWTSSNSSVVAVNRNGLVGGMSEGTAVVSASSGGQTDVATITVSGGPPRSLIMVGAGDIASCASDGDEATADLLDVTPGTVFTLGDNAYPDGAAAEYANCYDPHWGRQKARTRPIPGNHEYQTPNATGYFDYFGTAAHDPAKGYYSFDVGEWHIIMLNSELDISAGSPEEQWLRADLAAHANQCTMAMWHEPRFTSSVGRVTLDYLKPLWDALYEAGADLILNGHDHNYERFALQTPGGVADASYGLRQFTVGTGGESHYGFGTPAPNSQVRGSAFGVLKLILSSGSYAWEFIPVEGQTFTDNGTTNCHGAPQVSNQAPASDPGGPYTGVEGAAATFDGSGSSDPDGDLPLAYGWSFGEGGTGSGVAPSHTYLQNGSYTVSLVVTDAKGANSPAVTTTATIANAAPTVNAGADVSLDFGATLNLNATFSDPGVNDAPWTYSIDWGDGGAATTGSKSSQSAAITASHTYAAGGQYTVRVSVTDKDNGSGTDDLVSTVGADPNQAPVSHPGGPYTGAEGAAVAFDGSSSSDPDGDLPLTYAWSFGDGGTGTGATPSHAYAQDGTYTVALVVTDGKGRSGASAATTAAIGNAAPTVSAGADVSLTFGATLNLNATFSDPGVNDAPWTYSIDWGDGGAATTGSKSSQSAAITASHTYAAGGQYTVRVSVTDKDNGSGTDDLIATMSAPAASQVLVAASNIATCSNNFDEATAKLLDNIPGTVLTVGDNAMPNGTAADYANCYNPTWGRHKSRTYAVLGNHEYDTGIADAAFDYFGSQAGERGKGYYSFELGDWHIIVLNADGTYNKVPFSAGSAQELWLKADLAANSKRCTLALWHQERFFSSSTAGYTSSSGVKPLWDDLYAAGADVVVNGQRHQYERFAPQSPTGARDDVTGIRQFIVGTGGESVGASSVIAPNSDALAAVRGVLKLTLASDGYSWEFVPIPGSTFTDSGSGTCH
jgi:PKD repeat protein